MRGGPRSDRAIRHRGDDLTSTALGYTFCKSEWAPCCTSSNQVTGSATFQVIDRNSCGGSHEPGTIAPDTSQQWNCGGYTGDFTYFEPASGDQLTVDTYLPQWGPFEDPYVTCRARRSPPTSSPAAP